MLQFHYLDSTQFQCLQTKLEQWLALHDASLDEILRHDGLGDALENMTCFVCKKDDGIFKCKDCTGGGRLRCQSCIVHMHCDTPLHRIEVCRWCASNYTCNHLCRVKRWTGHFFDKDSLRGIGLRVQLGHGGNIC